MFSCTTFPQRIEEIRKLITACQGKDELRNLLGVKRLRKGMLRMHEPPTDRMELKKVVALDMDAVCVRTYMICNTPEQRTTLFHLTGDEAQTALDFLQMVCDSLFLVPLNCEEECPDIFSCIAT